MSKRATTLESKQKNLTAQERQVMEQAEQETLPDRPAKLKCPAFVGKAGRKYWRDILKRMDGLGILDDLDAEMLGVYCQMLARRDEYQEKMSEFSDTPSAVQIKEFNTFEGKLQALERNLLAFAEKLGLTPAGRVALARRKAAQALEPDPMFGD